MLVDTVWNIFTFDGSRCLSKPSFDIRFSGTVESKRNCNMFSLLHYFEQAPSKADENVMSNRSAKIGDNSNGGDYLLYPINGSLFCDSRKYTECVYVHRTFALLSIQPTSFVCGESPDFNIGFDGKRIGVEVTCFHSSAKGADGRPRRAIEEEWNHLQGLIMSEVDRIPKLKGIFGILAFHALDVPTRRQHEQFVQELLSLSLRMIAKNSLETKPVKKDYPLLSRYVKKLTLKRVGCYITWEWDRNAAFVGLSEQELIDTVTTKAARTDNYRKKDQFDELWLLVVSEHRLSQTMPPFLLDILNSFGTVNKELQKAGFAKVFLYQYLFEVVYEWPGWKKVGEAKFIPTIDEFKNKLDRVSG